MTFHMNAEPEGVVRLNGRLDASKADAARRDLEALPGPLTLDCAGLEYISSAGLSVLVVTYKRLHAEGQTLRLVNLQPNVRNILTYAGFHRLLHIE